MTNPRDVPPTVVPARYSKGNVLVKCPSLDGFKTRAGRLAEAMNGRYTNREGGYVMSATKGTKFLRLYAEGWDGGFLGRVLIAPATESEARATPQLATQYVVAWDNGAEACGTFPERFDTHAEAQAFGENWLADWGVPPADADGWYSFEVLPCPAP